MFTVKCQNCGSNNTYFSALRESWYCEDCGKTFGNEPSRELYSYHKPNFGFIQSKFESDKDGKINYSEVETNLGFKQLRLF